MSSLSRVNADKPWELYEALFGRLLSRCQASSPGHGFRFKNKLHSLDATVIDLCLPMFSWAKFRRAKGALKVHVGMDHEGRLPTFVTVTEGRTSDIEVARTLRLLGFARTRRGLAPAHGATADAGLPQGGRRGAAGPAQFVVPADRRQALAGLGRQVGVVDLETAVRSRPHRFDLHGSGVHSVGFCVH